MKRTFKKYEFADESTAQAAIDNLPSATDEEGNVYPTHRHSIVKLGYLWLQQPTFDQEGNQLTDGSQSDKYSVDVLWEADVFKVSDEQGNESIVYPSQWEAAEIAYDESWVSRNGAHTFMGWSFS